ncbi:hypothetical protein Tco_1176411 [Tanacetum coccineum]
MVTDDLVFSEIGACCNACASLGFIDPGKDRNQVLKDAVLPLIKARPIEIGFETVADNEGVPQPARIHELSGRNNFGEMNRSIPLILPLPANVPRGGQARSDGHNLVGSDRMRELEATGEHTTAEINAMVRGGKLRGHIPGVGPVMPGYVRSRLSYTAPVDRSREDSVDEGRN